MEHDQCNGSYCSLDEPSIQQPTKPLEIYHFLDVTQTDGLRLIPVLKKLELEYGHLFRLRTIATIPCAPSRSACDMSPLLILKAIELQGKTFGMRFMRRLRMLHNVEGESAYTRSSLIRLAEALTEFGLDLEEFHRDVESNTIQLMLEKETQLVTEWDVRVLPTLAFIGDEEAIKAEGAYEYLIYVSILNELLDQPVEKQPKPPLEHFLKRYETATTSEIAFIYDVSEAQIEHELKKLALQQKCVSLSYCDGKVWRHLKDSAHA
ncbi:MULTISPECIES: DsbA family protein [unclassified Exiguobacterium]|uniref:DsbA family protein n=1 Tax=unclassified Exiguobacterium TaxID=2644629 RepID=UPI000B58F24B|nr:MULTISPECIES: DsbA family protein [unclassified Exiguobacterium]ASI35904.1 thioredoxin [Exiguobacterium sp. N4-1P]